VLGVIGLLIEAKAKGYIARVQPCLDELGQKAGFYLSTANVFFIANDICDQEVLR
jgi:predicted nucleic acid-binding protein